MGKLRFLLALWLGKLSIPALKITHHNGTDFPGSLAVKVCPDFLKYVGKPPLMVAVTGTNGKTTVSNMPASARRWRSCWGSSVSASRRRPLPPALPRWRWCTCWPGASGAIRW